MFATAGGRAITVSDEALEKAKKLLEADGELDVELGDGGVEEGGNERKAKGASAGKETQALRSPDGASSIDHRRDSEVKSLFVTAAGREVRPSAASLEAAAVLLGSVDDVTASSTPAKGGQGADEAADQAVDVDSGSGRKGGREDDAVIGRPQPSAGDGRKEEAEVACSLSDVHATSEGDCGFAGFTTAGGKAVKVSEAALARAARLLAEDEEETGQSSPKDEVSSRGPPSICKEREGEGDCGGFVTAGGRAVNVSADAMEKAKRLMEDVAEDLPDFGFATAGGRSVSVSKEAMAKAQALLDGVDAADAPDVPDTGFGFATAGGRSVSVSKEAVAKAQALLDDVEADELVGAPARPSDSPSSFFATAGGAPVTVSKEALARGKALMAEVEEEGGGSPMFAKASGKPVQVSEEAMAKSRQFFDAMDETADEALPSTPSSSSSSSLSSSPSCSTSTPSRSGAKTPMATPRRVKASMGRYSPVVAAPANRRTALSSAISSRVAAKSTGKRKFRTPLRLSQDDPPGENSSPPPGLDESPTKKQRFSYPGAGVESPVRLPKKRTPRGLTAPRRAASTQGKKSRFTAPRQTRQPLTPLRSRPQSRLQSRTVETETGTRKMEAPLFDLSAVPNRTAMREMAAPQATSVFELRNIYGLAEDVATMTLASADSYRFLASNSQVPELSVFEEVGVDEMRMALLAAGAREKYLPTGWLENAYGLIVWKLAAMERAYPDTFAQQYLTPDRVLLQLKYRYEREIIGSKTPAIRQILEKDQMPSKHMVLIVSQLVSSGSASIFSSDTLDQRMGQTETASGAEIEVTDGWYRLRALLDDDLTIAMQKGQVYVGQKLRMFGARLSSSEATTPLENTSVKLVLCANSTRRAPWHAMAGFQRKVCCSTMVRAIKPKGGLVPAVDVVVERLYPLLYMESGSNGVRVTRNERDEQEASRVFEQGKEKRMEAKRMAVERQVMNRQAAMAKKMAHLAARAPRAAAKNPEQLYYSVSSASDPSSAFLALSEEQQRLCRGYEEQVQAGMAEEMRDQLQAYLREDGLSRKVTPFVRCRIRDCPAFATHPSNIRPALLTVWGATAELLADLVEGRRLRIFGLMPSSWQSDDSPIQLTANRSSLKMVPLPAERGVLPPAPRSFTGLAALPSLPRHEEFDTVVVVVHVGVVKNVDPGRRNIPRRYLYATDVHGSLLILELSGQEWRYKLAHGDAMPLALLNVKYQRYDKSLGTHVAVAQESAVVSSACKSRHLADAWAATTAWLSSPASQATLAKARTRAQTIEGGTACGVQQAATSFLPVSSQEEAELLEALADVEQTVAARQQ